MALTFNIYLLLKKSQTYIQRKVAKADIVSLTLLYHSPHHLHILRTHLHPYCQQTWKFHKQTLDARAAGGDEATLVAVKRAANDADAPAVHGRSYFFGKIETRRFCRADSMNETLHIPVGHGHGFGVLETMGFRASAVS